MPYNPTRHHRRSIRLQGYDYAQAGAYFVTLVADGREHVFGEIRDDAMVLNELGQCVLRWWDEIPRHFPSVDCDAFVIMPNHMHGIIVIDREANAGARIAAGSGDVNSRVELKSPSIDANTGAETAPLRSNVRSDPLDVDLVQGHVIPRRGAVAAPRSNPTGIDVGANTVPPSDAAIATHPADGDARTDATPLSIDANTGAETAPLRANVRLDPLDVELAQGHVIPRRGAVAAPRSHPTGIDIGANTVPPSDAAVATSTVDGDARADATPLSIDANTGAETAPLRSNVRSDPLDVDLAQGHVIPRRGAVAAPRSHPTGIDVGANTLPPSDAAVATHPSDVDARTDASPLSIDANTGAATAPLRLNVRSDPACVDLTSMSIDANSGAETAPQRVDASIFIGMPRLGQVIGYFKYQSTKEINQSRGTPGARIWQRNYHERIIRDRRALEAIRGYIVNNPLNWAHDSENHAQ